MTNKSETTFSKHSRLSHKQPLDRKSIAQARASGTTTARLPARETLLVLSALLPVWDFLSPLVAGYLVFLMAATIFPESILWNSHPITVLVSAIIAPFVLYQSRTGLTIVRSELAGLFRGFLGRSLIFSACAALILTTAEGLAAANWQWFAVWFGLTFALSALGRVLLMIAVRIAERSGALRDQVAIVGAGPLADRILRNMQSASQGQTEVIGIFDDRFPRDSSTTRPAGSIAELIELGKARRIDWILLTIPCEADTRLEAIVRRLKALAVPVGLCPQNLELGAPYSSIDYLGGHMPITLLSEDGTNRRWHRAVTLAETYLPRWIVTLSLLPFALVKLGVDCIVLNWRARAKGIESAKRDSQYGPATATGQSDPVYRFDDYELSAFASEARRFGQDSYGFVVTPNTDHMIRFEEDRSFRNLYAEAKYVLLDSRFVANVVRFSKGLELPVCAGSDLTARLFEEVIERDDGIVLIGASQEQAEKIRCTYGLRRLTHYNPPMGFIRNPDEVEKCLSVIEENSPFRFCLLAVGCPQQEQVAQLLKKRGRAKGLALCVGASINFLTGEEKRAPAWMQRSGMEWLYRLIQSPARLAGRYLVRGPRIFTLLRHRDIVLRPAQKRSAPAESAPVVSTIRPLTARPAAAPAPDPEAASSRMSAHGGAATRPMLNLNRQGPGSV